MPFYIFGAIIVILLLMVVGSTVRVVPQANEYVVAFLGKYKTTWSAGLHFKLPILETVVAKTTLKEQVLDSPPQPVITKDNVTMQIDTVVYFRIFDSSLYVYGAVNPMNALANLTATTLRNIVGEMELDQTLTSRDIINGRMTAILDDATDQWGIKVNRLELKNIIPPREIQDAMEKQMKAERDKRQTMLQAEAHRAAAITRAEGDKQAMILAAEGERDARIARAEGESRALILEKEAEAAGLRMIKESAPTLAVLELKKYESLIKMADGRAAKIIVPTDAVGTATSNALFSEITGLGDTTKAVEKKDLAAPAKDDCCDEETAQ